MSNLMFIILTLIFATVLAYMFIDYEVQQKKDLYYMGLFVFCTIIIDAFIWNHFGYVTFQKLYPLLAQIPLYIAFLFISRYKGVKLIFVHLTVIAIVTSIIFIALMISYFLGFNQSMMNMISLILYFPAGYISYKYFRPYILYMLRNTDKGWYGFCVIPLSYTILTYSSGKYDLNSVMSQISLTQNMRALIFTLISYSMILWLFKQNSEHLKLVNEQNLLQMQITASQQHLESLKDSQAKTIIYRHDMRHHLNLINAYLSDNNKEAAQHYINEVANSIDLISVKDFCDNYSLNLILHFYVTKAQDAHIQVETLINLPKDSVVTDMDLCLIFSNTLENAINALTLVDAVKEKHLKIVCKTKNNQHFIQIENTYIGNVQFKSEMPITTTQDHGYGTKSIAAIVNKYNGHYASTAEDGIFRTRIVL